ncbi:aromatic-ring-hydroxylating dioxygenase subunit beta [Paraburkholderia aspalathi]|jgi:anthranilate 1,2-dioxygenase small subunit|uniref:Anthranilate 1,2-dioxygenase small subunit n=1 Tax=Paraburkholderia aspalathi TaxID=1324617 RepID=A0A1I7DCF1_9BURK|nr:nuclear transport factor 2 family protein [Paraburkholderia aspalathi]SFU09369.1 anthranilate 1,2-dioxygenase small subunit [Paraburkholderia aspalathi]
MKPTPSPFPPELTREIATLYEDYAAVVDSCNLEEWPGYFTDDCLYRVIPRENYDAGLSHATIYCEGIGMVRDRAAATRDCTVYEPRYLRHFLSGVRISKIESEVIHATGSFLVIESVSDMQPYVLLVGQYVDRIVAGPDGMKFKERSCVYDNYRIFNSLVFPV